MQTIETTEQWPSVLADLAGKKQAAESRIEELRSEKRALSLEAAMGSPGAKKRLSAINHELTTAAFAVDDLLVAIERAGGERQKAEQDAAAGAERDRQAKVTALARVAVRAAAEFSALLTAAVGAGDSLKKALGEMGQIMTGEEGSSVRELESGGAIQRACEHAGLRRHLDFMGYPGRAEDILPLGAAVSAALGQFLPPKGKE